MPYTPAAGVPFWGICLILLKNMYEMTAIVLIVIAR